jgi:hypothetical protein
VAVALLLVGLVVALVPAGPPAGARAAGDRAVQPQETFASGSPSSSDMGSPSQPVETFSPSERTITIESGDSEPIDFGALGLVRGFVISDNPSCVGGQEVEIAQRPAESTDFTRLGTTTSRSNGRYSFVVDPRENADYIASVAPTASCGGAESDAVEIQVRVLVFLGVSDTRVTGGEKITLRVRIRPCGDHSKTRIQLRFSEKDDPDDVSKRSEVLDKSCRAVFKQRVFVTTTFRAFWPAQDNDHASGTSDPIVVKAIV